GREVGEVPVGQRREHDDLDVLAESPGEVVGHEAIGAEGEVRAVLLGAGADRDHHERVSAKDGLRFGPRQLLEVRAAHGPQRVRVAGWRPSRMAAAWRWAPSMSASTESAGVSKAHAIRMMPSSGRPRLEKL